MNGRDHRTFGLRIRGPSVIISGWSPGIFLVGVGLGLLAGQLLLALGALTHKAGWPVTAALLAVGLLSSWTLELCLGLPYRDSETRWLLAAVLASPLLALGAGWLAALPWRELVALGLAVLAPLAGFGFRLEVSPDGVRVAKTWWRLPLRRWSLSLESDVEIDDDYDGPTSVRIFERHRDGRTVELGLVCCEERLAKAFRGAVAHFRGPRPGSAYRS